MSEVWVIKTSDGEEYGFKTLTDDPMGLTYDGHYQLLKGAHGHHGMSRKYSSDPVPGMAGEELREEQIEIREIYMPIRIHGTDAADRDENKQALRRSISRASFELWITNEQGETRVFYCRYGGGFDKIVDDWTNSPTFINVPLTLICFDPYCYDLPGNEVTHTTEFTLPTQLFFDANPWFSSPWRLSSGSVNREWTVYNDGDEDAYPVWTLAGPGRAPILKNLTTGKSFALDYVLASNESITIDMTAWTVVATIGVGDAAVMTNARKYMIRTMRDMWALQPGPNDLSIEMYGGEQGAQVEFSFLKRFEGI
jgi:phage-related protein